MPRLVKYFGHASQILKFTIGFVTGSIVRNCSLRWKQSVLPLLALQSQQFSRMSLEASVRSLINSWSMSFRSRNRQIVVLSEVKNYREFTIVIWY